MELASKVLKGDIRAAARLISGLEDEAPNALEEMGTIYPHTGKAYIVGITGSPGAGKSTLTDNLIGTFRKKNLSLLAPPGIGFVFSTRCRSSQPEQSRLLIVAPPRSCGSH